MHLDGREVLGTPVSWHQEANKVTGTPVSVVQAEKTMQIFNEVKQEPEVNVFPIQKLTINETNRQMPVEVEEEPDVAFSSLLGCAEALPIEKSNWQMCHEAKQDPEAAEAKNQMFFEVKEPEGDETEDQLFSEVKEEPVGDVETEDQMFFEVREEPVGDVETEDQLFSEVKEEPVGDVETEDQMFFEVREEPEGDETEDQLFSEVKEGPVGDDVTEDHMFCEVKEEPDEASSEFLTIDATTWQIFQEVKEDPGAAGCPLDESAEQLPIGETTWPMSKQVKGEPEFEGNEELTIEEANWQIFHDVKEDPEAALQVSEELVHSEVSTLPASRTKISNEANELAGTDISQVNRTPKLLCGHCMKVFVNKSALFRHHKHVGDQDPSVSNLKGFRVLPVSSKRNKDAGKEVLNSVRFICGHCMRAFSSNSSLLLHQKQVKERNPSVSDLRCIMVFSLSKNEKETEGDLADSAREIQNDSENLPTRIGTTAKKTYLKGKRALPIRSNVTEPIKDSDSHSARQIQNDSENLQTRIETSAKKTYLKGKRALPIRSNVTEPIENSDSDSAREIKNDSENLQTRIETPAKKTYLKGKRALSIRSNVTEPIENSDSDSAREIKNDSENLQTRIETPAKKTYLKGKRALPIRSNVTEPIEDSNSDSAREIPNDSENLQTRIETPAKAKRALPIRSNVTEPIEDLLIWSDDLIATGFPLPSTVSSAESDRISTYSGNVSETIEDKSNRSEKEVLTNGEEHCDVSEQTVADQQSRKISDSISPEEIIPSAIHTVPECNLEAYADTDYPVSASCGVTEPVASVEGKIVSAASEIKAKIMDTMDDEVTASQSKFSDDELAEALCGAWDEDTVDSEFMTPDDPIDPLLPDKVIPGTSPKPKPVRKPVRLFQRITVEEYKILKNESGLCDECGQVCKKRFLHSHKGKHLPKKPVKRTIGGYPCPVCPETFDSNRFLRIHLKRHPEWVPERFLCDTCGKSFVRRETLRSHIAHHLPNKPWVCEICAAAFKTKRHLGHHRLNAHGTATNKTYTCPLCKEAVVTYGSYMVHRRQHIYDWPNKCPKCPMTFPNLAGLNKHVAHDVCGEKSCDVCHKTWISGERPCSHYEETHCVKKPPKKKIPSVPCTWPGCAKMLLSNFLLRSHVTTDHEGLRPFLCDICGYSSKTKAVLKTHIMFSHSGKTFPCTVCGQVFSRPSYLPIHMRKHTGERPYACSVCGKSFRVRTHMNTHMRVHTGEKPYVCKICGRGFAQRQDCWKHAAKHPGAERKPHSCRYCGTEFPRALECKKHERTHHEAHTDTDKKMYHCQICDRAFITCSDAKEHERISHHENDSDKDTYDCQICDLAVVKRYTRKS